MANIWFISDTHFGHANIITFKDDNGDRIRPFDTIEEHDELIVQNWNNFVQPADTVYHLGDVGMNRRCLPILHRLRGRKVLIKGNHDIFKLQDYIPYFKDIRAYKIFPAHGLICSHIPVHTGQLEGRWKLNAHGHTHHNIVARETPIGPMIDDRYRNICVEHTKYAPVSLEEILA